MEDLKNDEPLANVILKEETRQSLSLFEKLWLATLSIYQ